ncbi:hypothetical protein Psuf_070830 [Phytohabitans suffuscus]|uniref:Uncharacterized protein n=1 Tax=Phytohabitans suffuscus TaxID=624315 RepID=A0A6F8YUE6_9ACTN|nr:hypothetical protein Psuf_070830 [Phytohabitans suffuscus]
MSTKIPCTSIPARAQPGVTGHRQIHDRQHDPSGSWYETAPRGADPYHDPPKPTPSLHPADKPADRKVSVPEVAAVGAAGLSFVEILGYRDVRGGPDRCSRGLTPRVTQ